MTEPAVEIKRHWTRQVEAVEGMDALDVSRQSIAAALHAQLVPSFWWTDSDPFDSGWLGGALAIKLAGGHDSAQRLQSRLAEVRSESMLQSGQTATVAVREDGAPAVAVQPRRSLLGSIGAGLISYTTPIGVATGFTTDPTVVRAAASGAAEGAAEGARTLQEAPRKVREAAGDTLEKFDDWLPWLAIGLGAVAVVVVVVAVR